jgi:hypothetical protein
VRCATAGDDGRDAERSQQPTVLVVVIPAVGEQPVGLSARAPDLADDRPPVEVFDQRQQLGDVVALPSGQANRKWDAAGIDKQVVL